MKPMTERFFKRFLEREIERRGTTHQCDYIGTSITKDNNDGSLVFRFSKSGNYHNYNPDIRMKFINRRSLGYISILSRFMNYQGVTDLFIVKGLGTRRSFGFDNLLCSFNSLKITTKKQGIPLSLTLTSTCLNFIGLRGKGRYEIDSYDNNYVLTQTPDIFMLSLVKASDDKKEIKIEKQYGVRYVYRDMKRVKEKHLRAYNLKINPKDLVLLVNNDTLMNTSFMRDNYSLTVRKNMIQAIRLIEIRYETMFGFKPEIQYVDDSEIQKHIRLTSEKDDITSLTKIMKIDQSIKEDIYTKQLSKREKYIEQIA